MAKTVPEALTPWTAWFRPQQCQHHIFTYLPNLCWCHQVRDPRKPSLQCGLSTWNAMLWRNLRDIMPCGRHWLNDCFGKQLDLPALLARSLGLDDTCEDPTSLGQSIAYLCSLGNLWKCVLNSCRCTHGLSAVPAWVSNRRSSETTHAVIPKQHYPSGRIRQSADCALCIGGSQSV